MYFLAVQIVVMLTTGPVCGVSGFVKVHPLRKPDQRISEKQSTNYNQRNVTSLELLRILESVKDLKVRNLQFLHNQEYEDIVKQAMKYLSIEYIGGMSMGKNILVSTLNQMLANSNVNTVLVLMDSPMEVLYIFKLMRGKMLKSHLVKWLLIMEGDEAESSLVPLEEMATEGTQIKICIRDSRGILNFFTSKVDVTGVTRFRRFKSTKKQHPSIINFGDQEQHQYHDLSGRLMTIAVIAFVLSIELGQTFPDGSVELKTGADTELIKLCSSALNFTYRAVLPPDGVWGNPQPDGTVTGVIGMVARREVSFAIAGLGITENREKVIDFAHHYFSTRLVLFSRSPKEKQRALAVFSPFSSEVWIAVITATLLMGLCISLVARVATNDKARAKYSSLFYLFNMFRSIVIQGNSTPTATWSKKWILISWYFFCFLFYAMYSGMLTAVLAIPSYEAPINSLHDLPRAVKEGYTLSILPGSTTLQYFETATEGVVKQTWELFTRQDPSKTFLNSFLEAIEKVVEEKRVHFGKATLVRVARRLYGKRKIHISSEGYIPMGLGIACQTGSPLTDALSRIILRFHAMGIITKKLDDEYRKIPEHPSVRDDEPKNFSISLVHLQAAFYIILLGMVAATFVLVLEQVAFSCSQKKQSSMKV